MTIVIVLFLGLLIPLGAVATGPTIDLVTAVAGAVQTAREAPRSIGVATMSPDGTLVLDLRAQSDGGPGGATGDARLVYSPDHPDYRRLLDHIGPLRPGESRPVPPWPEHDR